MFNKTLHFIKYNNLTVFIILGMFLLGAGVFAQTPTGEELIGQKNTEIQGTDNTLLLSADLDKMDMEFKIEKIEKDSKYYYITYTYLDLAKANSAWQYQELEKVRKVSIKLRDDLGEYMSKEFYQQYEARIKDLKIEKEKASVSGEKTRIEITEYTGLIGKTLDLAGQVFTGYEPIKKRELPSPEFPLNQFPGINADQDIAPVEPDDLAAVYENFMKENDLDEDSVFGTSDNCPNVFNPEQEDGDDDGIGDACDTENLIIATSTPPTDLDNATSTPPADLEGAASTSDFVLPVEEPTTEPVAEPVEEPIIEPTVEIINPEI